MKQFENHRPDRVVRIKVTPEIIEEFGSLGLSRKEMAERLGCHVSYINRMIANKVSLASAYQKGYETR